MSKKKSVIAVMLIAVIAIVAVLVHRAAFAKETTEYRFTAVTRGNVESSVSATGTLSAVTTVAVGTQVSGQISELLVDFNDTVKKRPAPRAHRPEAAAAGRHRRAGLARQSARAVSAVAARQPPQRRADGRRPHRAQRI